LQADDSALDRLEEEHRQENRENRPEKQMQQERRPEAHLRLQDSPDDHVADEEHDDIGREVIGAVMMHGLAARVAMIDHLEKSSEQASVAAGRAAAKEPSPKGLRRADRRVRREDRLVCHEFRFSCFGSSSEA
jgi:hypothetical protein